MSYKSLLKVALLLAVFLVSSAQIRAQALVQYWTALPLRGGEGARVVFENPPADAAEDEGARGGLHLVLEVGSIPDASCRQAEVYTAGTSFAAPAVQFGLDAASTQLTLEHGGDVAEFDLDPCFGGEPVAVLLGSAIPPGAGASPRPFATAIFDPEGKVRGTSGGGRVNIASTSAQRIPAGQELVIPIVGAGQAAEIYLVPQTGSAGLPTIDPGNTIRYTLVIANPSFGACSETIPVELELHAGINPIRLEKNGAVLLINGEEVFLSEGCLHAVATIDFELNQSGQLVGNGVNPTSAAVLGYAITEAGETVSIAVNHLKSKGSFGDEGDDEVQ